MSAAESDFDDLFNGGTASAGPPPPKADADKAGADNRKESRVRVKWPARVLLPDGSFRELRVFDLCESGVGFESDVAIPANAIGTFALAVPDLNGGRAITVVTGRVKIAHMTIKGHQVHCGGAWVELASDGTELLLKWIRRLRK